MSSLRWHVGKGLGSMPVEAVVLGFIFFVTPPIDTLPPSSVGMTWEAGCYFSSNTIGQWSDCITSGRMSTPAMRSFMLSVTMW